MAARRRQLLQWGVGLLLLTAAVGCLSGRLPVSWRPAIWSVPGWATVAYVFHLARDVVEWVHRLRKRREADRAAAEQARAALKQLRRQLQQIGGSFEPDALALLADSARRETTSEDPQVRRRAWEHILAVEGPSSEAWLPLAELVADTEPEWAWFCLAEAVRCGRAEPERLWSQAAKTPFDTLPERIEAGDPSGLIAAVANGERLSPLLYRRLVAALGDPAMPIVLRALCARELFEKVGDREEAARWRERVDTKWAVDAKLQTWVRGVWGTYRLGGDWLDQPTAVVENPSWCRVVPPCWLAAMGLGGQVYDPRPPRYLEPLPMYSGASASEIGRANGFLNQHMEGTLEGVLWDDESPLVIIGALSELLWPRWRRSRACIARALERLAMLRADVAVAAALGCIGAALAEETDPQLADLRAETERLARKVGGDHTAVRALTAAGDAHAPVDLAHAWTLWTAARRGAVAEFYPAWNPALVSLARSLLGAALEPGPTAEEALSAAVDVALRSRNDYAAVAALLVVLAKAREPTREALVERFAAAGLPDPRVRWLLAWENGSFAELVDATCAWWPGSYGATDDVPRDQAIEGFLGSCWTPLAVAVRAGKRDVMALGSLVEFLADRAAHGEDAAVGGWLACGFRLDRLDGRQGLPHANAALKRLAGLPTEALSLPIAALCITFEDPTPSWLAATEKTLVARQEALAAGTSSEERSERRWANDLMHVIWTARLAAQAEAWLEAYRVEVSTWLREPWH